jgi:hypothetical protein
MANAGRTAVVCTCLSERKKPATGAGFRSA